jgi:hypothetical protein
MIKQEEGQKDREKEVYKIGKNPVFSTKHLETLVQKKGYKAWAKQIEDERCESDLMYRLFKQSNETIDTLLRGLVELIEKKNAPDLGDSRMHRDAMAFLFKHPRVDAKVKLFYILLIVAREPEAQRVIEAGYDTNKNIWGNEWQKKMSVFFKHLEEHVTRMYNSPFGETNIEQVINDFVNAAELLYLSNYT